MTTEERRLGLRENLGQFSLLVAINAFVGAMVGMERTVLPLLAEREFGIVTRAGILSFLVTFGIAKAIANGFAGRAADRWGRRRTLLAGWIAGLPVPFLIIFAPSWGWVVAANIFLGVNQGLCWSAAVVMKVDLVGPRQRGFAIGLNESSGYLAVSAAALASGYIAARWGLRPAPFLIGVAAVLAGLVSSLFAKETRPFAEMESAGRAGRGDLANLTNRTGRAGPRDEDPPSLRAVVSRVSWSHPPLRAVSAGGLVNNLNDGMSWGLFPLFFISMGSTLKEAATLVAVYPAVWGLGQLVTGFLSDRYGRRWLMAGGMTLQGLALIGVAASHRFAWWLAGMILLGAGTALVYPTFLGAVSDHSDPGWRASAIGVYRWWRDLGYALGAVVAGGVADLFGIPASIALVGALTVATGVVLATSYEERKLV